MLGETLGPVAVAPDQLHHHIHAGVGRQGHGVVVPTQPGCGHAAVPRAVPGGDRNGGDGPPGPRLDECGVVPQQAQDARADRSQAGDAN